MRTTAQFKRQEPEAACPVCSFDQSHTVVSKSFGGISSTWLRCASCQSEFIWPLPSAAELEEYYRMSYAQRKSPGAVSHSYRFSEANRGTIFREYGMSLADVHVMPDMLSQKRILDYGCANGFFLDFCVSLGCRKQDLCGFDIAEDLLVQVARKGYHTLKSSDKDFDFIFLWDVLEHIPEPAALINHLKACLRPGGTVIVQTPRLGFLAEVLGELWEHYLPLEHVVLYGRGSLRRLFEEAGLRLVAASSFGSNAPPGIVPEPYKQAFDRLAKRTDYGSTQIGRFVLEESPHPEERHRGGGD